MSISSADVKGTAPLRNVVAFNLLVKRVVNRADGLPGMACFHGRSGLGKTKSAIYGANTSRAIYVEVGQFTSAKSLLRSVLIELGMNNPRGTIAEMIEQAIYRLSADIRRPLIVDEAHHIAERSFVDVLRELHDKSSAPVIMIGEETLPASLEKFERVHNRILEWVGAEACDLADARSLAKAYCAGVAVGDDLLQVIVDRTAGNTRRIVVNLARVLEEARKSGRTTMLAGDYDLGLISTHKAPTPRSAA